MKIHQIPLLRDNYGYLLVCEKSKQAAIVDPSEAEPVLRLVRVIGEHAEEDEDADAFTRLDQRRDDYR